MWNGVIYATTLTVGEEDGVETTKRRFTLMGETVNHYHSGVRIGCLVFLLVGGRTLHRLSKTWEWR
jgi:hypothetical protein